MKTKREDLKRECFMGGPGLDGYAYKADTYCADCAREAFDLIPDSDLPESAEDPSFSDSDCVPNPIFFGESDCEQTCGGCGEYLYGPQTEPETT